MNVLLTCAGRRNYLVHLFKAALGDRGRVIACDSCPSAPALTEADEGVLVPRVDHPDYYDVLVSTCRERRVRLLFPLNDLELVPLANQAWRLREVGTVPVVAPPEAVATCLDKWAAFAWLRAHDVPTPETYLSLADARRALARGVIRFPLLVKPRWGSASVGVERLEDDLALSLAHEWARLRARRPAPGRPPPAGAEDGLVIQEWVRGQEFGIDVVNDLEGRHVCTFARRKLGMRAGETDRAVTVADPGLEQLGKRLGQRLGHVGNLDCDVMGTEKGWFVLDLNPRFGGGYPFSHAAGANLPAAFLAWASGEEPEPSWLRPRPGVASAKCDRVVVLAAAAAEERRAGEGRRGPGVPVGLGASLSERGNVQ